MNSATIAISFQNISKTFGQGSQAVQASRELSFNVRKGTIHGIVGENGAGKSTAMKILFGMLQPDSGNLQVKGKTVALKSSQDAVKLGIGMVHQHFMLSGPATILDNILLSSEQKSIAFGFLPVPRSLRIKKISELAVKLGLKHDLNTPAESLSVGEQQKVEILKLLVLNSDILILDEPTAVLTPIERDELFQQLKEMRSHGKTILLITHKLKEVLSLTDDVTVMRAGQVVGSASTHELTEQKLADWMVGRDVTLKVSRQSTQVTNETNDQRGIALEVNQLSMASPISRSRSLEKVQFQVRSGEVVGVAGVEGNGQSELIQAILGVSKIDSGTLKFLGNEIQDFSVESRKRLGLAVVPEDRHRQGLILDESIFENFLLDHWHRNDVVRGGMIQRNQLKKEVVEAIQRFDIRPPHLGARVGGLSGGNQQKVMIARELMRNPKFLLVAQPTRGVDVGAIEKIHSEILRAKNQGTGVLLISSELEEILTLSDRILVFYSGKIVAEFQNSPHSPPDERQIGMAMGGSLS